MWRKVLETFFYVIPILVSIIWPILYESSLPELPFDYTVASFITVVVTIIFFSRQNVLSKNKKIKDLERTIEEGYLSMTSEYKELSQFRFQKIQEETLRIFVRQNSYVPAVQVYEYSLTNTHPLKTMIKLKYLKGFVDDGEEINAIIRSNYEYEKGDIRRLQRAISKPKPKKLAKYLASWKDQLNNIPHKNDISEKDVLKFSLLQVATDYSYGMAGVTPKHYLNNNKRENELNEHKRTGISRAIISSEVFHEDEPYHFKYNRTLKKKQNRAYISMIRKGADGEKYLYLITVQVDQRLSQKDHNNILIETENNFEYILKERKLLYND